MSERLRFLLEKHPGGPLQDALLEEVYRTYFPSVRRLFLGARHSPQLCDDLTQHTFLRVQKAKGGFQGSVTALENWLFTIARNLSSNARRSRRVRKRKGLIDAPSDGFGEQRITSGPSWTGPSTHEPVQLQALLEEEQLRHLEREVERLPAKMRHCFKAKWFQGMKVAKIAAEMGVSDQTVKSHLHQAQNRLRVALRPYFDDLSILKAG